MVVLHLAQEQKITHINQETPHCDTQMPFLTCRGEKNAAGEKTESLAMHDEIKRAHSSSQQAHQAQ